jgi:hypothetical protein
MNQHGSADVLQCPCREQGQLIRSSAAAVRAPLANLAPLALGHAQIGWNELEPMLEDTSARAAVNRAGASRSRCTSDESCTND